MNGSSAELNELLTPAAVRNRSRVLFDRALEGKGHFRIRMEKLREVADLVVKVTLENYPDLNIPFHSRFGHFRAGGIDRLAIVFDSLQVPDQIEQARLKIELAIVSVLLDAGAGMAWSYPDPFSPGTALTKSEGLAVASLEMFWRGRFHS